MRVKIIHFTRDMREGLVYEKPCDSFNYNFMRFLATSFRNGSVVANVIDTTNTARAIGYTGTLNIAATAGVTTYGLRVGTNGIASAPGDYNLGALVSHGIGDGLLAYGGVIISDPSVVGNVVTMSIKRSFINGGSTDITMRELDLVSNTSYNVEFLRDSVADQVIPSMQGITVEVVIRITV